MKAPIGRTIVTVPALAVAAALGLGSILAAPGDVGADPQEGQRAVRQPAPDSPRARKANAFVEAMQDGSDEALRKLVEEEFSAGLRDLVDMAEHLSRLGQISEAFAQASDLAMGPRDEFVVAIRLQDETGETLEVIVLELDQEPPHGITGIRAEQP